MMNVYALREGGCILGYYSSKAKARQALLDYTKDYHVEPVTNTELLLKKSPPMSVIIEFYNTEYPWHFFSISKLFIDFPPAP